MPRWRRRDTSRAPFRRRSRSPAWCRAPARGVLPRLMATTWNWPMRSVPPTTAMMRPWMSLDGARSVEVDRASPRRRHQPVAAHRLQRRCRSAAALAGLARALDQRGRGIYAFVAEQRVVVRIAQLSPTCIDCRSARSARRSEIRSRRPRCRSPPPRACRGTRPRRGRGWICSRVSTRRMREEPLDRRVRDRRDRVHRAAAAQPRIELTDRGARRRPPRPSPAACRWRRRRAPACRRDRSGAGSEPAD